ncbi:MAG: YicC/YloC family endoribonuclease [Clostridia bacterium]|nr:YicC/YloC family endoribonuclease [Clostridia bacterium]
MYSMTGYGKAEYSENGVDLIVEIKTVNNRNFDFNVKMPRLFLQYEDAIRKKVNSYVSRARVETFITFSDKSVSSDVDVDVEKAKMLFSAAQTIAKELAIENDLTPATLLRFPDVVSESVKKDADKFSDILLSTVEKACVSLNEMRLAEGKKLIDDMLSRMQTIESLRQSIVERAPLVAKDYEKKLRERIEAALSGIEIDQARLLSEVAFFVDKSNIDEELTRLGSHINQFKETVNKENCGKKLDFLMQEFNRETNTICSKSNDLAITDFALKLKNEIEKVREQVQNIE